MIISFLQYNFPVPITRAEEFLAISRACEVGLLRHLRRLGATMRFESELVFKTREKSMKEIAIMHSAGIF